MTKGRKEKRGGRRGRKKRTEEDIYRFLRVN